MDGASLQENFSIVGLGSFRVELPPNNLSGSDYILREVLNRN